MLSNKIVKIPTTTRNQTYCPCVAPTPKLKLNRPFKVPARRRRPLTLRLHDTNFRQWRTDGGGGRRDGGDFAMERKSHYVCTRWGSRSRARFCWLKRCSSTTKTVSSGPTENRVNKTEFKKGCPASHASQTMGVAWISEQCHRATNQLSDVNAAHIRRVMFWSQQVRDRSGHFDSGSQSVQGGSWGWKMGSIFEGKSESDSKF